MSNPRAVEDGASRDVDMTVCPSEGTAFVHATVANGVTLEYESFGALGDPVVVLVAGFGAQLISWDTEFCRGLADRGRYVVRFDNRDAGLSTKFDQYELDIAAVVDAASVGNSAAVAAAAPYTLREMADDVAGLVRALGLAPVHVVGASLGGMIAQLVAIRHRDVCVTLTSMMSSTGAPDVGQSTPEALAALLRPSPPDHDGFVASSVQSARTWSSRRFFDADAAAKLASASYRRCHSPGGTARQIAALLATGSLEADLRRVNIPTLVIHGTDDTLVTPSGGKRTAELIPDARLLIVEDMGHDRPRPLWPVLWNAVIDHTAP